MERDSLGIRLRDLPLMTLAISTRTPQQALAALLENYAPQHLLLVGARPSGQASLGTFTQR